jgi:surface protein
LSHENKLLIRCAWAGNQAFASAGYGSGWGSGTCAVLLSPSPPPPSPSPPPPSGTFTTKASLRTAVEAYNGNQDAATATYGLIADWDVSMITDMSWLFYQLTNFNADISSWDTSKVTTMHQMFRVRPARALAPDSLESGLPPCMPLAPPPLNALPPPVAHLAPHRMCMCAPPFDSAGSVRVQPAAEL